jgi:2-keto-3-deoxy-L-rhamnonate aldolase RhmA
VCLVARIQRKGDYSMKNHVKDKLRRGLPAIGTWNMIGHSVVTEILAQAGFDWVGLDMEHGVTDWPQAVHLMQAMQATQCLPLCRLPINQPEHFKWALDAGAFGVIVPFVNSEEEARRAVAYAKYPPQGIRGISICRAHGYGASFEDYVRTANEETLVILQVEHIDSVHAIEQICAVPGVDAVFIGPYDLSGSMGLMGQVSHPDVLKAVDHVREVAEAHGVVPGLLIVEPAPNEVHDRIEEGFRLISVGLDTVVLSKGMRAILQGSRSAEAR